LTIHNHIRDQQVNFSRNRYLTCLVSKILFLAAILNFFSKMRSAILAWSYRRILLVLNSKQWKTTFYLVLKFWRKSDKNCDRESARTKKCKMAAMTSSISNFQNPRKTDLTNISKTICRKFHQNQSIRLGCSAVTHTHIHTHTYKHTYKHTYIHTPSVWSHHIQSKRLNIEKKRHFWESNPGCLTAGRRFYQCAAEKWWDTESILPICNTEIFFPCYI